MSTSELKTKEKSDTKPKIEKSKRKLSLDEFSFIHGLRVEETAGFKIWLEGKFFHMEGEWHRLLEQYKNRELGGIYNGN